MDVILWTAFKGILILGVISVSIALIGLYLKAKHQNSQNETIDKTVWPYKRKPLLTHTEQRFFALLHEALPEHQIFVQVALNQMLKIEKGENWSTWYNRIAQLSVDFVISDQKGYVIAAIELDDKTHDNDKNRAKDAKKDKALNSAGIEVLRYRCEAMPSINTLQKDIEKIYSLMTTK